jgi:hypothetical protein
MWRPDMEIVEKKKIKIENEMDRGPDYAARQIMISVVMNCQMCLMGSPRNFPPPFDLDLFILCCSHIPFLLLNIIFVFLRFHSRSVLYNQYYTWNSPFRVRSPDPVPINSGLPTPPL